MKMMNLCFSSDQVPSNLITKRMKKMDTCKTQKFHLTSLNEFNKENGD